jgi:hypothetical protein
MREFCLKFLIIPFFTITLLISCGSGNGDSTIGNTILLNASVAINSVMDAGGSTLTATDVSVDANAVFQCDENGWPETTGGTQINAGSYDNWAASRFYCLLESEVESPETVKGTLYLIQGILCAVGELTYDGQTIQRTATISTACFSQRVVDEMAQAGATSLTMNVTPSVSTEAGWNYQVVMTAADASLLPGTMSIKLKNSDGLLAAAYSNDASATSNEAFSVALNQSTGTVWYEAKFLRLNATGGSDTGWNRHARLLVQGTFSADYSFTAISNIEGVWSNYYQRDSDSKWYPTIATIKGNGTAGYKTRSYYATSGMNSGTDINTLSNYTAETACYPAAGCASNSGISFTDGAFDFLMLTSLQDNHPISWYTGLTSPLSFTSVNTGLTQ